MFSLLQSQYLEMMLSIVWTICVVLAMLIAAKKQNRRYWFYGMALLVVVIIKLFTIDMHNSNTISRIVAFLAVGGLTLIISYFSPLPPKKDIVN